MGTKAPVGWRAFFIVRNLETGEVVVENEILQAGLQMTLDLWNGDTTETFDAIAVEDSSNVVIASKAATKSKSIDTSGTNPVGVFTSTALFASGDMTSATDFVTLVGSAGTIIARASLALNADTAYEITRKDYLGEDANVIPS